MKNEELKKTIYIAYRLLLTVVAAVLLTGCSHDETQEAKEPVLTIYVYAPEHPITTRGDVGGLDGTAAENRIQSLHIWVFEHESGSLVGYLNPTTTALNNQLQDTYLMNVSADFAKRMPSVDVYVLANQNYNNFGADSQRSDLDAAVLDHADEAPYGLKTPTTSVPASGLPMSGVLRNQPIYGDYPVLRIGSKPEMATVRLERIVSKLRFIFSRSESSPSVVINSVTLNSGMIPKEEYLFLADDGKKFHVGSDYESAVSLAANVGEAGSCSDPQLYIYTESMEASYYNALVEIGIGRGELTQAGPYYLRESDRQLRGTIYYSVDGSPRQANFQMAQAGDFSRNHTWTVYGYFSSTVSGDMELNNLFLKDWSEVNRYHELYNW